MKVGVYVDGYNLYYGARSMCGRGVAGWRWLDVRSLAHHVVSQQGAWAQLGATVDRIVYCTARIDAVTNPSGHADQDVYLKALTAVGSVDHIEYGYYVANVKQAVLAVKDPVSGKPVVVNPQWPVMVQDAVRVPVPNAKFMVSYLHQEEKAATSTWLRISSSMCCRDQSMPWWSSRMTAISGFRSDMLESSCRSGRSNRAEVCMPERYAAIRQMVSAIIGGEG